MENRNQHINRAAIDILDHLSNREPENYNKLLSFATDYNVERIQRRIDQLNGICSFFDDKQLKDFDDFLELEHYVLKNYELYTMGVTFIEALPPHYNYTPSFDKIVNKYVPKLTGSTRDKIVSLLFGNRDRYGHSSTNQAYKKQTVRTFVEHLIHWYKHHHIYKFFDLDIEKFTTLDEMLFAVSNFKTQFLKAYNLMKQIKPELLERTDKFVVLERVKSLEKPLEFYSPLIEQSNKFTDFDYFFSQLKRMDYVTKIEEVFKKLENLKIKVIHYDSDKLELVVHVETFEQIQEIGAPSWCLSSRKSDWDSYTYGCYFVMRWTFDVKDFKESSLIGVCLNEKTLGITNAQDRNNRSAQFEWSNEELREIKEYFNRSLVRYNEKKPTFEDSKKKTEESFKNRMLRQILARK